MKNILLLSNVMIDEEYNEYQSKAKIKINPSNQNFYSRLLKALSFKNNVIAVSARPFTKKMFDEKYLVSRTSSNDKNQFFYSFVSGSKYFKAFRETKAILRSAEQAINNFNNKDFVVVVDTLKPNLVKAALKIKDKHHVKVVGMLTDNPSNLSNVSVFYVNKVKKYASKLDGYLSLSDGLIKAFNVNNKPSYIFEGLVDEVTNIKEDRLDNYFFFAGSLYERYGVKNMIDAFKDTSLNSKLLIAGSGPLNQYLYSLEKVDSRILYLSQLNKENVISYEKRAIANINPRPLDNKLDNESIPSKLLEYLSSGKPTISTKHPKLYETFKDGVFWIEDSSTEGIKKALEEFSNTDETKIKKMASTALVKVYELYGVNHQGEKISQFLDLINSKDNS